MQHQLEKMSKDGLLTLLFVLKGKSASSTKDNVKNFIVEEIAEHLVKLSAAQGSGDGGDDKKGGDKGDGGNDEKGGRDSGDSSGDEDPASSKSDGDDFAISITMPCGAKTLTVTIASNDTVAVLKTIIKNLERIPRRDQRLIFGNDELEDGLALSHYCIQKGSVLRLALRGSGGVSVKKSATKKKAAMLNPFNEETPEYPSLGDAEHFQSAFGHGIQIGVMTKDTLNVQAMLDQATGPTLDRVIYHLEHGTSHHHVRLEDLALMLPFVQSMARVETLCKNSSDRFKKLIAAKLWDMGTSAGGSFKMESLVAFVRGVRATKP